MQPAPSPIKAILYDLDGTLVDNFGAIHRSIAHAQQALGLPISSYEKVRATVGGGIEMTLARLVGPELAPQALPYFTEFFQKNMFVDLHPLPGAAWMLEQLHARGLRQAVLTNKHGEAARATIAHLGWSPWIELVLGTHDTPWRKPMAEFGRHALQELQTAPAEALMIGDSPFDIEAGINAGLRSQAVTTGSHTRAQLLAHQPAPEAVFDNLHDLATSTFGLPSPTAKVTL
jgi:HAD superfamily hydrolase (TIGR01509 family)